MSPQERPLIRGRAIAAVHCVGVAGMGLGPLAVYLVRRGFFVSGEDDAMTEVMRVQLERAGVRITATGDLPAECDLLAYSSAIGPELYARVKDLSLQLYQLGHDRARQAGMILADTKFEFGTDAAGNLFLIDEVLTPDSSRYWPADAYRPDCSPPSYDKQFVRDHLIALKWDQKPPAPALPADVIQRTQQKYLAALRNLLG